MDRVSFKNVEHVTRLKPAGKGSLTLKSWRQGRVRPPAARPLARQNKTHAARSEPNTHTATLIAKQRQQKRRKKVAASAFEAKACRGRG